MLRADFHFSFRACARLGRQVCIPFLMFLGMSVQVSLAQEAATEDAGLVESNAVEVATDAPPATGVLESGNIVGQLIDAEKGGFVAGADVILEWPQAAAEEEGDLAPRTRTTRTDENGRFRFIEVPVGYYTIRFEKLGYRRSSVQDVEVSANAATRIDFPLPPAPVDAEGDVFQLEEFQVSMETLGDKSALLDELRQSSAGSIDVLSSEDFSKYAATDLADVVGRMPGVNVVEGKFAVVRGLGDRYNSTLVNGLPISSPDPLRQGLQLDLFPTSIIDNVVTNKQFLPYMPGNSSGAAFELGTRSYPEESTVWFKGGARFNSNAQESFLRDPNRGTLDYFGYGKSSRPPVPPATLQLAGDALGPTFGAQPGTPPVGATFSAGIGNSFRVFDRNLGVILAGSYDSSYTTQFGTQQDRFGTNNQGRPPGFPLARPGFIPGSLFLRELDGSGVRYNVTSSEGNVLIGALGGLTYELDPEGLNKLSFVTLYSHNALDFVQRKSDGYLPLGFANQPLRPNTDFGPRPNDFALVGRPGGNRLLYEDTISYEERNLQAFQFFGEHVIEELDSLQVDWGVTFGSTSSETPAESVFTYAQQLSGTTGFYAPTDQEIGEDFLRQSWRSIDEDFRGLRADVDYDYTLLNDLEGEVRGGFYYENAVRRTDQVDTIYAPGTQDRFSTIEELIQGQVDTINRATSYNPSFADNERKIRAGYIQATFPFADNFEITGGARLQQLYMFADGDATFGILTLQQILDQSLPGQTVTNGQLIGYTDASTPGVIDQTKVLPAVTLTYDILDNLTLRAGYSKTVAQPSFREMAPYFSRDLFTGDLILGNPNLQTSEVSSWDARLEYRFDYGGLLAFSAFYKDVDNPIERILLQEVSSGSSLLSFFNNPDRAIVKGFEVEARSSIGVFAEELEDISLGVNWSMINATVAYPDNVWDSYFSFAGIFPTGPFVGTDGPPLGINSKPQERRLFDQPEWIVNADITYDNPDIGTLLSLSVYAQSDVLTSVGSGIDKSIDQFTDTFYQLDFTLQQNITENLVFKFSIKNITDTPRAIIYSNQFLNTPTERITYKNGRDYRFSLEYTF